MTKTSGMAVASLVLGILSLLIGWLPIFGWLLIILAVVFGFVALSNIKKDKSLEGRGLAIAGIVMGLISFLIIVLIIVGFAYFKPTNQSSLPQEAGQQPAGQTLTTTISPARDLTGKWAGSITFTNNCPNPTCTYIGRLNPPSVILNLRQNGNNVAGDVTIDFANFEIQENIEGSCGTFQQMVQNRIRSQGQIANGVVSSSRFTFSDPGGNFWELSFTTDLLQGTVSNNAPGCMGISSDKVKLSRQ